MNPLVLLSSSPLHTEDSLLTVNLQYTNLQYTKKVLHFYLGGV
jgi:hypothetical protein